MRSSIRRTWRSVTFNRLAAATCVRCFCFTSCNTFNRSRSRWLKAMRSVSMGPSANHESGHFYFAQTGHSHFAATAFNGNIDNGARFGYHLPREVRTVAPSGGDVSQSSLVSPPDHSVGEDARRSTRIERSVPLIVFGQNRLGEPFVERTVSTSLNLHGCRYPSRHDYGVGSWVTLQVVGLEVEPKPPAVRARVRSVHTSQSLRCVDRAHSCAHRRGLRLDFQSHHLQRNPRSNAVIVPRGIPAPMQVQAGRDRSFYKWLAKAVLTENDQRDGPLDARAAPRVFSHGIAGWINKRRLAHVRSKPMQRLMPVAPQDFRHAETSFPQGGKTPSKCEAASSTSVHRAPLAELHVADVSRSPLHCRYLRGAFRDSGSASLVGHPMRNRCRTPSAGDETSCF